MKRLYSQDFAYYVNDNINKSPKKALSSSLVFAP